MGLEVEGVPASGKASDKAVELLKEGLETTVQIATSKTLTEKDKKALLSLTNELAEISIAPHS